MATIRKRKSGNWEIIIRRKILPKAHSATFDTEEETVAYATGVERLLDQGILPVELQERIPEPAQTLDLWARLFATDFNIRF